MPKNQTMGNLALAAGTQLARYSYLDAVCVVLNENAMERFIPPKMKPPPERKPFRLLLRHRDNRRVVVYLQSRGIDKEVILDCINSGNLYEVKGFHNCCFIGRDECGKARYAALRGTAGSFKCDVEGSDKEYGFAIPPHDSNNHEVAVFEAPIDALSHRTLCRQGFIPPSTAGGSHWAARVWQKVFQQHDMGVKVAEQYCSGIYYE